MGIEREKGLTMGSLFDGSGGFPLAAKICGITPVWASEIDPFCVAVTSKRFPKMKHLGDITKIKGGGNTAREYNNIRQSVSGFIGCGKPRGTGRQPFVAFS